MNVLTIRVLTLAVSSVVLSSAQTSVFTGQQPASSSSEKSAVEVGMKFQVTVAGQITALRFYKFSGNTGTHTGTLWSSSGTVLGRVTFTGETASGWQRATLASPVLVSPGTTYIVSYNSPNGRYAQTEGAFSQRRVSSDGLVFGLASSESGGNGVYRYGGVSFPSSSYNSSNYWVDVEFTGDSGTQVSSVSLWGNSTTPAVTDSGDSRSVEVGMKFRSSTAGNITAIRFYKASSNTGTHVGSLWSATGTLLGRVTFTSETAFGWQTAVLSTPVQIAADTTYVVSYLAPAGRYSKNEDFFSTAATNAPLRGLAAGESGANGVYLYGSGGFPTSSHRSTNYWVDVVFSSSGAAPGPPAVSISLSPATASLGASQTQQFTAVVSGSSNTSVTWSLSPALGTISASGLYRAPSSVTAAQVVAVTATSVADPSKTAVGSVTLRTATGDTTPPTVSINSPSNNSNVSGTVGLSAAASDNVGVASVQFRIDGTNLGSAITGAPYTTSWNAGSVSEGSHTIQAIARDAAGNSTTASIAVNVANSSSSKIELPVEVIGANGLVKSVTFPLAAGDLNANKLSFQIHGLDYDGEASVQVNNSGWISISDQTATINTLAAAYGGIGGGFQTIKLTVNTPAGSLVAGTNTIRFRYNYNNGDSSGYRVLKLNLLRPDGSQVLSSANFENVDPDTWVAPRPGAADIAEGKRLWSEANLIRDPASRASIRAKCMDCHTQDGRDLKYYNFSNESIQARSVFHGLSTTQGEQIASYIRTLNVNNPGRPWNPPYQPGPGLDSKPATEWAAGAGIDYALDDDSKTLDYIPSSSYATSANLSARETPIAMQLPDWNHWLPQVHPKDAYGDTFVNSQFNAYYGRIRASLRFKDGKALSNATGLLTYWEVRRSELLPTPSSWTFDNRRALYSASLWKLTKLWEVMNEFELQEFGRELYGPQADVRAWWDHDPFLTSPNMLKIEAGNGLGNGSQVTRDYVAMIWYHLQLILNNSNKLQKDNSPLDWPYVYGFIKTLGGAESPCAGLHTLWMIKAFQISDNGKGPEVGETSHGWNWRVADVTRLVHGDFSYGWQDVSSTTRKDILERLLRTWLDQVKRFSASQFYAAGVASSSLRVRAVMDGNFGERVWYAIPRFRYYGVNQSLINEFADWAQSVWPANNWGTLKTSNCSGGFHLYCSND